MLRGRSESGKRTNTDGSFGRGCRDAKPAYKSMGERTSLWGNLLSDQLVRHVYDVGIGEEEKNFARSTILAAAASSGEFGYLEVDRKVASAPKLMARWAEDVATQNLHTRAWKRERRCTWRDIKLP